MNQPHRNVVLTGIIREALKNRFRIEVCLNQPPPKPIFVMGYLCGDMRRHRISVVPGDHVRILVNTQDPNLGRIIFRFRDEAR